MNRRKSLAITVVAIAALLPTGMPHAAFADVETAPQEITQGDPT